MPKSYELRTTNKCDWSCDYCCVDIHNQPIRPIGNVRYNIYIYKKQRE